MAEAIVRVREVSKQYRIGARREAYSTLREAMTRAIRTPFRRNGLASKDTLWALREINFEVAAGEVLGIIGRNGAGKSTLLKILSRITEPTTGRAELFGRIGSLLEVGTGFHPELSGRENVFLNGAILGMRKAEIERKFDEIVAFAEIERFLDTPVKRYSSGMYVRLAFAVAAHLEPEILIVDEVLAVGDSAFQKKCLGKMGEVARGGRTVLFVSHNMRAVAQLCATCIWIDHGRVVERGKAGQVVVDYLASVEPERADGLITDEMHEHEPVELCFTRVALLDAEGKPTSTVYSGQPLRFEVEFRVDEQLDDARLALALQRPDETLVCALHNTDGERMELLNLAPGHYVARLETDAPLMPGRYSVALLAKPHGGFWNSGDRSIDYVRNALAFSVGEVSREGLAVLPTGALVLPRSVWTIEASPDAL